MMRLLGALLLLGVLLVAGIAYAAAHWFSTGESLLGDAGSATESLLFEVAPGAGIAGIARDLHAAGYLQYPRVWRLMAQLRGQDTLVQAGEYALSPEQTPEQLLMQLVNGTVRLRSLVLVEGSTVAQMLTVVQQAPKLRQTLTAPDAENLLSMLDLPNGHAEGQFFPDTYRYAAGESDVTILRQAYYRMREVLDEAWDGRAADLPYQNPQELLIMASIIEKETGAPADRAQISQVFATRLRIGMRLQTDPTVIYGLGSSFDGDIRSRDLVTDTPYNTYTRHGLPPTPISLPGRAALLAAAQPAEGDYLYFVSRGDGTSQFSRTLDAHNAAVRQYQLRRSR